MDLADNISSDSTAHDSLDVLERRLYNDGHRSRSKLNAWLVESGVPLEAATTPSIYSSSWPVLKSATFSALAIIFCP
ncbi:hypothetical protein QE152_g26136 [Popillia japonica]|uniref:Uncharacterized protein n=1 Tax=Popillia japonica TaxID=7064 RepID=A0AAW1JZ97_POPJA